MTCDPLSSLPIVCFEQVCLNLDLQSLITARAVNRSMRDTINMKELDRTVWRPQAYSYVATRLPPLTERQKVMLESSFASVGPFETWRAFALFLGHAVSFEASLGKLIHSFETMQRRATWADSECTPTHLDELDFHLARKNLSDLLPSGQIDTLAKPQMETTSLSRCFLSALKELSERCILYHPATMASEDCRIDCALRKSQSCYVRSLNFGPVPDFVALELPSCIEYLTTKELTDEMLAKDEIKEAFDRKNGKYKALLDAHPKEAPKAIEKARTEVENEFRATLNSVAREDIRQLVPFEPFVETQERLAARLLQEDQT